MVLRKIGLTGATGMLGRHLDKALRCAGAEVVPVSRSATLGDASACWDLAEWRELEALDELFPEVHAIIHAGAMVQPSGEIDKARMFNANVRACFNLGEWAISRNVPMVFISGAIVYADTLALEQQESAPLGWEGLGGFYGFSKLLAEDVLLRLRQQGLKLAVVRPTSIYGFGISADKMVARFLANAEAGDVINLTQPVLDRVDLIHAADVSRAVVAVLERACWDTFNLSSGNPISVRELAEACVEAACRGRIAVSGEIPPGYRPATRYSLDSTLARRSLGWQAAIGVKQGLKMVREKKVIA